jgi:hypothetical protein
MPLQLAQFIVYGVELYALAGLLFAVAFLPRAIVRFDHRLEGAPIAIRFLILPGVAALWPRFAWRWTTDAPEPIERNPHRAAADISTRNRNTRALFPNVHV